LTLIPVEKPVLPVPLTTVENPVYAPWMAALFLALLKYPIFICFTELSWPLTTQDYSLTLLERDFAHGFEGKELGGLSKREK
jgi:hypothetical protein